MTTQLRIKLCTDAAFKMLEEGNGGFEGYASTFGNYDRAKEAVAPGAFKNLDQFKLDGFGAVGHNWYGLPIAMVDDAHEDEKGLFVKASFHSTKDAQDARTVAKERMAAGKSVGLSIGYQELESEPTDMGTLLKALHLYEFSMVTVPCNPLAGLTGAKGFGTGAFDLDSLPGINGFAGLKIDDQGEVALALVEQLVDWSARLKGHTRMRVKVGRTLSASNRDRLAKSRDAMATARDMLSEMHKDMDELLTTTEPDTDPEEGKAAADLVAKALEERTLLARKAHSRFLALCSALDGHI